MKNLLKSLGLFAIAGTLGLNVMNVSADGLTCPAGQTVHTNYYLFLDVNSAEFYRTEIGNATDAEPLTAWTGADKYNNIGITNNYITDQVGITSGSESTVERTEIKDTDVNWTVSEFWQKFYKTWTGMDSTTLVYTENGTDHYIMHDKWWSYDGPSWGNPQEHTTHADLSGLMDYIKANYDKLSTSDLVRNGTSLPKTRVTVPNDLGKTNGGTHHWYIARSFSTKDIKTGAIDGSVFSPAAHYVQYCAAGTSSTTPDTADKTIIYNQNTTDTVTGMPANQTFKDSTTIATNTPVRAGYQFLGWSTNSSATTGDNTYAAGKQYSGNSITLYAIWAKNYTGTYSIKYNANGGKNAPATQTGNTDGACLVISSEVPTHSNAKFKFLGWSRNPDAIEPDKAYAAGEKYCGEAGDIDLYAVWQTPPTGIGSQIITFAGIALISGAALVIAKKKNLFKQI